MNRFHASGWTLATLVGLSLLASSAEQAHAGTIPPGTYTTPPGFVNTKSLTVTAMDTASGTGVFKTLTETDISFTIAAQPTGDTTTYAFSETLQNLVFGPGGVGVTWKDFEMTLGGNVGATFTGTPFSNRLPKFSLNKANNDLTFYNGAVLVGQTVTFGFSIVVPNPKTSPGVLILTEQATVPEPSTLVMSGIGMMGLVSYVLKRKKVNP